ncbi:glycoside hydrolase family 16 protein [Xylariomycetidae sp. FL0641]|nr:glycoside hydrolase family 16 protein [Xylariomycetidae sp. FL0641]
MSFRGHFNQLRNKAEELNKKHNLLPIGQNKPPQQGYGAPAPPPGQWQQPPPPQGQWQQPPPQGQWQQPPPPGQDQWQQQEPPPPPPPNYNTRPGGPPPIPTHSRPGAESSPSSAAAAAAAAAAPTAPGVYWRPHFSPQVPVSAEFEHKQGHGDPWGWGNEELENYTAAAANSFHTADGKLVLRALAAPAHPDPEARWTSARLVTRRTLGRADGCLSARLTLPCAPGVWPACWLLPREPFAWPHEGEVDVAEAWNGEATNHACLHWGHYRGEDRDKHRVRRTPVPGMAARAVRFDFAWQCGHAPVRGDGRATAGGGRLMWSVDGRPVMKNIMPPGTRRIEDWCVLLNVAMGGTVCQGQTPQEGAYDMVVHDLQMTEAPEGGWQKFDADWQHCPDGAPM